MQNTENTEEIRLLRKWISIGIVAVVVFVVWVLFGYPVYRVWAAGQKGRAELAHAEFERKIQVTNAKANLEAQKYNAEAEVQRSRGVAQANNIIKDSITDQYIRYLWVQTLDKGNHDQIIYVPTELGLPITEAGRATIQPSK